MTRPNTPGARKRPGGDDRRRGQRGPVAAARRSRYSGWTIGAIVVIILFAVGVAGYVLTRPAPQHGPTPPPQGVATFANLSREHVTGPVTYPQTPPVGGPHAPVWQNCGIYTQPVANENAVHSLEHGAVWITYQPSLPAGQVSQLRTVARGQPYVLLSPYPDLPTPVVASAWGVQLRLADASDPRLAQFIAAYQRGPQTPEPDAPCTGGTGHPQS
jgi:hypothetical protein